MGFSDTEASDLLDAIEEVLPIGMDEWGIVLRQHEANILKVVELVKKPKAQVFYSLEKDW